MAIINGQGRVGVRVTSGSSPVTPQYPSSLKLFIDAGNPLSYSGTGTTVTDLVGTQNGTLVNGVGYSSSNGGYFTFDGVNDYITFGINTAIQPTAARTVSTWVYVDSSATYGWYYFSDGDPSYTGRNGFGMWHDSNGYRSVLMNTSTYQVGMNDYTYSSKGVWKYLTTSWNGTTIKTYLNGTLVSSYSQTVIPTNGVHPTLIGRDMSTGTLYLKGRVSQLKIYNTQLSDAEVTADFNEFKTRYGFPSDSDAAAFVSAAGITDPTQMSAVNTLVTSLKTAGIWSKMKALYPFVGGNATAHSKNLINPSQYPISWYGGMLHDSNGITGNGSNAYGKVADLTSYGLQQSFGNNILFGVTARNNTSGGFDIGCKQDTYQYGFELIVRATDNLTYNSSYDSIVNGTYNTTNSIGTWYVNRIGNNKYLYKNGTQLNSFNSSPVVVQNYAGVQLLIGAGNRGGNLNTVNPSGYSSRNYSSMFIGYELTNSESTTLYNAIQAFQTTLGRQV